MKKKKSVGKYQVGTIYICEALNRRRIKLQKKTMFYARYLYECAYGKVPKGYCVHHIDFNKLNDILSNLQLMTIKEHYHMHMLAYHKRRCIRINEPDKSKEFKLKQQQIWERRKSRIEKKRQNTM